jgi:hypothetical protein
VVLLLFIPRFFERDWIRRWPARLIGVFGGGFRRKEYLQGYYAI